MEHCHLKHKFIAHFYLSFSGFFYCLAHWIHSWFWGVLSASPHGIFHFSAHGCKCQSSLTSSGRNTLNHTLGHNTLRRTHFKMNRIDDEQGHKTLHDIHVMRCMLHWLCCSFSTPGHIFKTVRKEDAGSRRTMFSVCHCLCRKQDTPSRFARLHKIRQTDTNT